MNYRRGGFQLQVDVLRERRATFGWSWNLNWRRTARKPVLHLRLSLGHLNISVVSRAKHTQRCMAVRFDRGICTCRVSESRNIQGRF